MTKDAISATIVLGGREIILKNEVDRNKLILPLILVLLPHFFDRFPCLTPLSGRPHVRSYGLIKSLLLKRRAAPPPLSRCLWQFVVVLWMVSLSHELIVSKNGYSTNFKEELRSVSFWPTLACTTPDAAAECWALLRVLRTFYILGLRDRPRTRACLLQMRAHLEFECAVHHDNFTAGRG